MILIALSASALLLWAVTGTPVQSPVAAFTGFVCGFSWALVWAMHAIERAGL